MKNHLKNKQISILKWKKKEVKWCRNFIRKIIFFKLFYMIYYNKNVNRIF